MKRLAVRPDTANRLKQLLEAGDAKQDTPRFRGLFNEGAFVTCDTLYADLGDVLVYNCYVDLLRADDLQWVQYEAAAYLVGRKDGELVPGEPYLALRYADYGGTGSGDDVRPVFVTLQGLPYPTPGSSGGTSDQTCEGEWTNEITFQSCVGGELQTRTIEFPFPVKVCD